LFDFFLLFNELREKIIYDYSYPPWVAEDLFLGVKQPGR